MSATQHIEDLKRKIERSRNPRRYVASSEPMTRIRRLIKDKYLVVGQPRAGERNHGFLTFTREKDGLTVKISCWMKDAQK